MKILKIKVKISALPGGGTQYSYPQEYWDSGLRPIVYESENSYATVKARKLLGDFTEYILCVCENETAYKPHPDFTEITALEANTLGSLWTTPVILNNFISPFNISDRF